MIFNLFALGEAPALFETLTAEGCIVGTEEWDEIGPLPGAFRFLVGAGGAGVIFGSG